MICWKKVQSMVVDEEQIRFSEDQEITADWVAINYGGKTGYVSSEYVQVDFEIDYGETVEQVKSARGSGNGETAGGKKLPHRNRRRKRQRRRKRKRTRLLHWLRTTACFGGAHSV
ncbi:MAG: hypothetical protein ACLURV_06705 [Gallintestinimicrobium sp.]